MARTERTPLSEVIQERRERGEKWCSGCAEFHPFSEFGPNKGQSDGLAILCREAGRESGRRSHAKKMGEAYRPRVTENIKQAAPEGMTWCNLHLAYCPTETFGREPRKDNGLQSSCNPAQVMKKSVARSPVKRITSKYKPAPEGTRYCWWHKAYEPVERFYPEEKICKEAQREKSRTYPEANAAKERNRRARRRGNGGRHTGDEVLALGERQGWKCANPVCRVDIEHSYDADHVVPVVDGGSDDIFNIQLLCIPDNRKKSDKDPIEWVLSLDLDKAGEEGIRYLEYIMDVVERNKN